MLITPAILLKWIMASVKMYSGNIDSILKNYSVNGKSVILMYHRIISPACVDSYIEPGMYVTPETFAMHLNLLENKFNIVSIMEMIDTQRSKPGKPLCALTFDDGWLDFYSNVYPLLKLKRLPATVFLPTGFIGTEKWFWTDRLAEILRNSSNLKHRSLKNDNNISSRIMSLKGSLFPRIDKAIKILKNYSQEKIDEVLLQLENIAKLKINRPRAFLNWDECRKMKNDGLISFGSHTERHIIMTSENMKVCHHELIASREKLIKEQVVDSTSIPFSYPNGNFSGCLVQLVKNTGYSCAVTVNHGCNNSDTDNLFSLKRVGMHQDMTSNSSLALARILKSPS